LDKREYKPGESGVITAMLNTGTYYGKVSKGITVTTDSTETPVVRLVLVTDVYAELRPMTTTLHFRNVVKGKVLTKKVLVENNMNKPLQINKVEVNTKMLRDKSYKIDAKVKQEEGKEYIVFSLEKTNYDYSFNNISIPVTVFTNSKSVSKLQFYLVVKLQKPIEIDPTSLFMYKTKIGAKRVKRVTITSNNKKPLKIVDIKTTGLPLTFEKVKESDFITHIWLGIKSDALAGRLNGVIILTLKNGEKEKVVKIPVRGTIVK
jgi:hypothetical protein